MGKTDAFEEHKVELLSGGKVPVLSVCCCCLVERDRVIEEDIQVGMQGNARIMLPIPIPWCNPCWSRHNRDTMLQSQFAMIVMMGCGIAGTAWILDSTGLSGWKAIVVLIVGTLGIMMAIMLVLRYLIVGQGPGGAHQPFCEGVRHGEQFSRMVEGGVEKGYKLHFSNREFAAMMRAAR